MDLRAQLDAAHRRISQLEKELEECRKAIRAQSPVTPSASATQSRTKVLTRSAAAALASQHTKSANPRTLDVLSSSPSTRARSKSIHRKIEPKLESQTDAPTAFIPPANQSCNEMSSMESEVCKPLVTEKPIQPAPAPSIPGKQHQFVPLHLNLANDGFATAATSPAQIAAKMTTVNIFSASSSVTTDVTPPSPTTSSNSKKASIVPKATTAQSKRHSVQATISKSTRKERSGLIAKCTEPRQGQTRYWTEDEHERFLEAVAQYGEKAYVAISNYVETRTPKQVRTHAQKFQMKVARMARERSEAGEIMELPAGMLPISIGIDPSKVICTPPANATPMQVEAAARAASENEARRQARRREAERETRMQREKEASEMVHSQMQVEVSGREGNSHNKSLGDGVMESKTDEVAEAVSSVSDVTSEELTDPYLNYIGGESVRDTVTEFDECFAARLSKPWEGTEEVMDEKQKLPVLSAAVALMESSVAKDDDLEDLDLEECGELPMASLINFGI